MDQDPLRPVPKREPSRVLGVIPHYPTQPPPSAFACTNSLTLPIRATYGAAPLRRQISFAHPHSPSPLALRLHFAAPCGPSRPAFAPNLTAQRTRPLPRCTFSLFSPPLRARWAALAAPEAQAPR